MSAQSTGSRIAVAGWCDGSRPKRHSHQPSAPIASAVNGSTSQTHCASLTATRTNYTAKWPRATRGDDRYAVPVGLATYRSCTFAEKRAVLRTFWSQCAAESDKVGRAAQEYGPYALIMVAVICIELVLITVALVALASASAWAWLAGAAAVLAGVSTWWTRAPARGALAI